MIAEQRELVADLLEAFRRSHDAAVAAGAHVGPAITFDRARIENGIAYALELAQRQGLVTTDLDVPALFAPGA
jgi:hypothetical protein